MKHQGSSNRWFSLLALVVGGMLALLLSPSGAKAQAGAWEVPPAEPGAAPPPAPTPAPPAALPLPIAKQSAPCTSLVVNCPSCKGGQGGCCNGARAEQPESWDPTPVGGYTLPKGGFGLKLEFGYPHMDIGILFALGNRVQVALGYRSVYTINHTPYANVKFSLNSRNRDVLGLALELGAGYSFGRDQDEEHIGNRMAGEYHVFGEAWLRGTARRGRHGLLFGVGAKISQAVPGYAYDYDYNEPESTGDKVMATISLEIGYELRINRVASFFLATGVDIFTSDEWIPALIRFRLGVIVGS